MITVFQGLGRPVSLQDWTDLNSYLLPGGDFSTISPATTEYTNGNMDDGYVLLNDNTIRRNSPNGYSYPKFQTAAGRYVSMRHGLWDENVSPINLTGWSSSTCRCSKNMCMA